MRLYSAHLRASAAVAALALAGLTAAQVADAAPRLDAAALRQATSWRELAGRDRLLSFTSGSARQAREELSLVDGGRSPLATPVEQAAAYLALGSGGDVRDRPMLQQAAEAAEKEARIGALLGLGELRPASTAFLLARAADPDPDVVPAACIALARSGEAEALEQLTLWSRSDDVRGRASKSALEFTAGGSEGSPGPAIDAFLALRWAAARRYGFVDGVRWKIYLEAELGGDEAFLDRVLLGATHLLRAAPRRDHLLELVLAGGTPERLRGAVAGCPDVLAALLDAGLWRPAGAAEWNAILDELASGNLGEAGEVLLREAAQQPGLAVRAGLLLVGADVAEAVPLVSGELFAQEAERRLAIAEALGGLTDPAVTPDLARLRRDRDPRVRAAALVAQVRRRDQEAADSLTDLLEGGSSAARSQAVQMLARAVEDPLAEAYLAEAQLLADLAPNDRVLVEVALASVGRTPQRGALRGMLTRPGIGRGLQELIVRALSAAPDRDDLAAMRAMFPVEDSRSLNVALALALIQTRDPGALGLLRQGIWRGPWNRSVLSAGLLARHGGIQALHDELASPPSGATDADLRRVGFALGEWGGLSEVDVLARRRRASDPAVQGAFLGALATRTQ